MCLRETAFSLLSNLVSLILSRIGLAKSMLGIKNVSAISRIKEKSNHHEGRFPLLLSKLVPAIRIETIALTTAASSVILGLLSFSGSVKIQHATRR